MDRNDGLIPFAFQKDTHKTIDKLPNGARKDIVRAACDFAHVHYNGHLNTISDHDYFHCILMAIVDFLDETMEPLD